MSNRDNKRKERSDNDADADADVENEEKEKKSKRQCSESIRIISRIQDLSKAPEQVLKFMLLEQQKVVQEKQKMIQALKEKIRSSEVWECGICEKLFGDECDNGNHCDMCNTEMCYSCYESHDCREKICAHCDKDMNDDLYSECHHCNRIMCEQCLSICVNIKCNYHGCKPCMEAHKLECIACRNCSKTLTSFYINECDMCHKVFCKECYEECNCKKCDPTRELVEYSIFCSYCFESHKRTNTK